jgi:hypothetical protein
MPISTKIADYKIYLWMYPLGYGMIPPGGSPP